MIPTEPGTPERAKRVANALNRFIGALHAARCTGTLWAQQERSTKYRHAAKYGLQLAYAHAVLTLRKFQDLWEHHLCWLLPATAESRAHCEAIADECQTRNLRGTANQLVAHYAADKHDWPLSDAEIIELIQSNGWASEEEVLEWVGNTVAKMLAVRDDLMRCYDIKHLTDEEVTL